jgi:hypothetical protein
MNLRGRELFGNEKEETVLKAESSYTVNKMSPICRSPFCPKESFFASASSLDHSDNTLLRLLFSEAEIR